MSRVWRAAHLDLVPSDFVPAGIDGVARIAVGAKAAPNRRPRGRPSIGLCLVDRDIPDP